MCVFQVQIFYQSCKMLQKTNMLMALQKEDFVAVNDELKATFD